MGRLRVPFAVQQEIGGGVRRVKRLAERRIPALSVAQQRRRAFDLTGRSDTYVRRVRQPSASVSWPRAQIGSPQQPGDGANDVAAFKGATGACVDRGVDVLVRRECGFGQMVAASLRLLRE